MQRGKTIIYYALGKYLKKDVKWEEMYILKRLLSHWREGKKMRERKIVKEEINDVWRNK